MIIGVHEFNAAEGIIVRGGELTIKTASPRLDMWITRYTEVMNRAMVASADEKTKLEWIYGDTEHCTDCERLNGVVAYAWEWEQLDLRPQNPPNAQLECGGWRCQCQLVPTDKRRTRGGLGVMLNR